MIALSLPTVVTYVTCVTHGRDNEIFLKKYKDDRMIFPP